MRPRSEHLTLASIQCTAFLVSDIDHRVYIVLLTQSFIGGCGLVNSSM